ncbi:STAS domain-containing protein [Shewanella psychrotolerans]|uniref:STAS domain-containing protein n=1 Tax=Shewanella psychrotolerans TaxID=2864206 RepID=UPI001C655F2C|nr:STAS domain-containing protein [Shewanella psychrotolerans]QYK01520.1 STAS domain-containing protein [Shewanella psychrotolerans]
MTRSLIQLDSELTIRNIQQIHQLITEQLVDDQPLSIDASLLTRVDTAGAQLLYFLTKYCHTHHQNIDWIYPSEDIKSNLAELGIEASDIFSPPQENAPL